MKKIIVLSNMYPSKEHPTYGIFVENQVELLRSSGQEVDVIAIENAGKGKITTLKKYITWFFRSFFHMLRNRKKVSLSHAHYAFPTGLISLVSKKLLGIPYVVTVHGGDIDKMSTIHPMIAKLTKKILVQAETVIVVGERLKRDVIERFGVSENNVTVMSMGVDTSIFKKIPKEEARMSLGLHVDGPIILFVGNIIKQKGLLELVEAYKLLKENVPDLSLYLIGSTKDSGFVSSLQSYISENKIQDVHFIGPKPQSEIAKWMSAANILSLPSYHEGFGLVALEAMAVGMDVVGTNVGGLTYLLADDAGILVQPKDVKSLHDGLALALNGDTNKINRTVVSERVTEHAYETILQKLQSIYRKAAQ